MHVSKSLDCVSLFEIVLLKCLKHWSSVGQTFLLETRNPLLLVKENLTIKLLVLISKLFTT